MKINSTALKNIALVYGGSFFGFVFVLILAKKISISDFSDYAYGAALGSLLMLIINFGSDRKLIFELVKYKDTQKRLINYNFTLRMSLFLVFSFSLFFLIPFFSYLVCLWYMALGLVTKAVFDYKGETIIINRYLFLERVILVILSFLLFIDFSLVSLFMILLILRFSFVAFTSLKICVSFSLSDLFLWFQLHRKEVINSFLFVLGSVFSSFQILGSQVIVKQILGDSSVSFLNIGFQIAMLVQLAQAQVIRMKSRAISESILSEKNNNLMSLNKEILKSLIISIPFVLIFNILAFLLEMYYLPESWLGVFELLYKFSPWLLVMGSGMYISQYFINIFPSKTYLKIYTVNLIFTCVSLLFLLPVYGVVIVPYLIFLIHGASIFMMYTLIKNKAEND
ncbi:MULTISPECIES: lipopolysaccharide biosynthesis protein [unclassified Pseudoalteromonas]|uniref:lipopolysaccharide biosynthesis protein n=1 Tax=unclassified Pseudoalteromonas TaxID=194690 RepID=UPI000422DD44|nr:MULTISPECIES: hypothetical protein [unclassified Pseudoalteromonas]